MTTPGEMKARFAKDGFLRRVARHRLSARQDLNRFSTLVSEMRLTYGVIPTETQGGYLR